MDAFFAHFLVSGGHNLVLTPEVITLTTEFLHVLKTARKLIAGLLSCSSWTPSTGPVSTAHSSTVIASRASSTSARLTTSD
ncbi:unnamed protein product [Ascophyllum nodosum]